MTCRFCGSRGHNRNGCPDVAGYAASGNAKLAAGADRYSLDWRERFAVSIAANKANRSVRASTAVRSCSYCNGAGHMRNKCPSMAEDRAKATEFERAFRTNFANWVMNSDLGIGAILTRKEWSGHEYSLLVMGINYNNINVGNPYGNRNIRIQHLDRKGWEGEIHELNIAPRKQLGYDIAAAGVPVPVPDSFLSDEAINATVSTWFDKKSTRTTRWNDSSIGRFWQNRPDFADMEEKSKVYAV